MDNILKNKNTKSTDNESCRFDCVVSKPFYTNEDIILFNDDCRNIINSLPPCDVIITDPPYSGLNAKNKEGGRFAQSEHHILYDDLSERAFLLFIRPIFKMLYEKLRLGGHFYCFTDWKQLRNMMDEIELASFKLVNVVCWDKGHFGMGAGYRSQSEYILVFSKGIPNTFNLKNVGNVIKAKRVNNLHPHQKPIDLLYTMIINSTSKGQTVLDPFAGSGSTLLAARKAGRKALGVEISQDYCELTARRLSQINLDFVDKAC